MKIGAGQTGARVGLGLGLAWGLLWGGVLLAGVEVAGPTRKVVVVDFWAQGDGALEIASALTSALVARLNQQPGLRCAFVHPASEEAVATFLARLSALEWGAQVAASTQAHWVILGGVWRAQGTKGEVLLASAVFYDAAHEELHLPETVRAVAAPEVDLTAQFPTATAEVFALALCHLLRPQGRVIALVEQDEGPQVQLFLDAPVERAGRHRYVLARRPPPVHCPETGEKFAAPPRRLGVVEAAERAAGESWFRVVEQQEALALGDRVLLAAEDETFAPPAETWALVVTSKPCGARVRLNGEPQGLTPLRLVLPDTPKLEMEITRPDCKPWTRRLSPADRARGLVGVQLVPAQPSALPSVAVRPRPMGFTVRLESNPPEALVLLDGVTQGSTPLTLRDFRGRHVITMRKPGYREWQINLEAAGFTTIKAELEPLYGSLLVASVPSGAKIFLDGVEQGQTPLELTNIPVGPHQLLLQREGYAPFRKQIDITPLQTTRLEAALIKAPRQAPAAPEREPQKEAKAQPPAAVQPERTPPEETVHPPQVPPPRPRPASTTLAPLSPRAVARILWERKILLRARGPQPHAVKAHLVVSQVPVGTQFTLTLAEPLPYKVNAYRPGKVYWIDLYTAEFEGKREFVINDPRLRRIRVAQFSEEEGIVRVVLDLPEGVVPHLDETSTDRLMRVLLCPAQ